MRSLFLLPLGSIAFTQVGYVEEGEASYYAPSFHGRRTASGEKYDRWALTAAHRTLPFDTYVRVTDKQTNKSVTVRINDRGPHKVGRIIDLSEKAAQELGLISRGVGMVRIEVTQLPTPPHSPPPQGKFYDADGQAVHPKPYGVQIGAFSEEANARTLARNARNETKVPSFVWKSVKNQKTIYRVIIGQFSTRKEAEQLRDRLRADGWQAFVVHLPI
ncbi:MAG: septal ring lytic transglycosylase RlpA family protein [Bacteroidia bacterium]